MQRCRWGFIGQIAGLGLILIVLVGCGGGTPSSRTLTAADNGATVQMAVGEELVVQLESNPSTGYGWQVTGGDAAVLAQQGDAVYTAGGTAPGSPGTEAFRFRGVAAGSTTLALGYSRPFEPDNPPAATFAVQVTVE